MTQLAVWCKAGELSSGVGGVQLVRGLREHSWRYERLGTCVGAFKRCAMDEGAVRNGGQRHGHAIGVAGSGGGRGAGGRLPSPLHDMVGELSS